MTNREWLHKTSEYDILCTMIKSNLLCPIAALDKKYALEMCIRVVDCKKCIAKWLNEEHESTILYSERNNDYEY